ncbi:MAG: Fe-S cluster assembly protein NifU [Deltaproteobacteria bacterium]|nr:Fe-S cluster assembly protein NifU [Deltaproteobacteria bacterium]
MVWNYSELVKKHFFEPKNVGKIDNADGTGDVGSIACGDALSLTIKVDKEKDTIIDAKFKTFGCGSAIASSSMLTEMVKGKTLDEALKITNRDIAAALGGLPAEKMHCSVMGREALEAAIADYRGEKVAHDEEDEGRIICNCFGITENKIRKVIEEDHLATLEDVTNYTKAGGGCGACIDEIETILEEYQNSQSDKPKPKQAKGKKLTNLERIALIQEVIDNEVRPELEKDSGGLDLIDIDGPRVAIRMIGQCSGCRAAGFTSAWIQEKLREVVDPEIDVVVVEEE